MFSYGLACSQAIFEILIFNVCQGQISGEVFETSKSVFEIFDFGNCQGRIFGYGFDARGKCSVMVQFVKAIFENIDFNCYQRRISGIV